MRSTWIHRRATVHLLVTWAALVVALLVASGPAHAQTGSTTLQATVGPEFTITLDRDGAPVTSLEAGTYTIEVDDRSEEHNFHLTGAGVDETTTVPEVTTATWTVTLSEGTYTFVCDPHADGMNGSFTVTAAAQAGEGEGEGEGELPLTGLDAGSMTWLGAALLAGGLALSFAARRGRPGRHGA